MIIWVVRMASLLNSSILLNVSACLGRLHLFCSLCQKNPADQARGRLINFFPPLEFERAEAERGEDEDEDEGGG
jgi:hypothetical protein